MESSPTSATTDNTIFHDESGGWSAARVFLAVWLLQVIAYIWLRPISVAVLTLDSGVAMGLIAWAGGARIAQYVGPSIGAAANAVGQSIKEIVTKRRDPKEGLESTP
jgi:hypothetical protein